MRFRAPRAITHHPVDGTRPPQPALGVLRLVAVVPPESARWGCVGIGRAETGQRFSPTGAGVRIDEGRPVRRFPGGRALFWTAGMIQPSLPMGVVLEELVDRSGCWWLLRSRVPTFLHPDRHRLDAYVDVGRPLSSLEIPQTEGAFLASVKPVCNFHDIAAAALILSEAGGIITLADGRTLDAHPAVGSSRAEGLAVLASASVELHGRLLAAIDRGIAHLGSWLSAGSQG